MAGAAIECVGEWSSTTAGPAAVGMDPCGASAALGRCGYGGYGSNPCHKKHGWYIINYSYNDSIMYERIRMVLIMMIYV